MEPTVVLTREQIDFYHREGFLVIPNITTPEEILRLQAIYDRIFEMRAGREEGNQFDLGGADEEGTTAVLPQILQPSKYAPELLETRFRVNALAVARQLLGPEANYTGDHAILKPARYGAPTPWHQDEAYWDPTKEYNSFSMWIPLQEATLENGCMQFIPGSHLGEIVPHHSIGNDTRVHGLEMAAVDASRAVACPLEPGGCTVHHNRTMHYAGPNNSDIPRRAYILGCGLAPKPRETPRSFPWNEIKQTAREARRKAATAKV